MIKLSVVIVNYNVKHFIEQCLFSVLKACEYVSCEVFVVDNNSVDGSVALIKEKFPWVILLENKSNLGFSVANNQAIKVAKGEYVLLLNPDTVVQEDTFKKVIDFMDQHPEAGALGVKMLDGQGNFAPESKRGLPTPKVALYKMLGLSKLFPQSAKFGRYHLTHLSKHHIHEIEVVSGAFMLIRKSVLAQIGLLDETFFMYGEDIDLSYRIKKAGYKNYYYPHTQIIHYKGESTKRNSLNYVLIFYKAMVIFSKKHFSGSYALWFRFLIHMAIVLKGSIAMFSRFIGALTVPFLDFISITSGLFVIKNIYQHRVGLGTDVYSVHLLQVAFSLYSLTWITMVYLNGGYDKPVKLLKIGQGVLVGTVFILLGYALLPESLRFSRALILLGTVWALLCFMALRLLYHAMNISSLSLSRANTKRIAIVGEEQEFHRVVQLLKNIELSPSFVGFVSAENNNVHHAHFIGNMSQMDEIIKIHRIQEIIFCAKDISSQSIIRHMLTLVSSGVDFKIAPPESFSIIGSNNMDTAGDLYMIDVNSMTKPHNKRAKRLLDVVISILALVASPVLIWLQERPFNYLLNCGRVLLGFYSWVGYGTYTHSSLPAIKRSVLSPVLLSSKAPDDSTANIMHLRYAKDYRIGKDLYIIWKCRKRLDN